MLWLQKVTTINQVVCYGFKLSGREAKVGNILASGFTGFSLQVGTSCFSCLPLKETHECVLIWEAMFYTSHNVIQNGTRLIQFGPL